MRGSDRIDFLALAPSPRTAILSVAMLPTDIAERLDQPLDVLDLPARMRSATERLGLTTVRDLVAIDPDSLAKQRNLGRTSLRDTRAALEALLGVSWETAAAALVEPVEAPTEARPVRAWGDLARAVPEALRAVPVGAVPDLPTRVIHFAEREHAETLGALVDIPAETVRTAPNLARKSVAAAIAAIVAFVNAPARSVSDPQDLDAFSSLTALWHSRVAQLDPIERIVLRHRAGLDADPLTLEETGELLGFTRERARQLEARAVKQLLSDRRWIDAIEARLRALLEEGARPVDALAEADPWFVDLRDHTSFGRFFFDRTLDRRIRYVTLDGLTLVSIWSAEDAADAWAQLDARLRAMSWPSLWSTVIEHVDLAAAPLGTHGRRCFMDRVRARCIADGADDARVLGYGGRRADEIEAFLRGAEGPVAVAEIARRFGRGHLPEGVVFIERGRVTLAEQLAGFDDHAERLVPRCEQWMRAHGPERQWSCEELAAALSHTPDLPDWFGAWPLAAMCARSERVRYVGRLAVVLPEVEGERMHVRDILTQTLVDAEGPLEESELRARALRRRGFSDFTLTMMLQRAPFVEVERERWGLRTRDLPEGETAAARATEWVIEMLEARACGLTLRDALARLQARSSVFERWTEFMLRSVLRHDPRVVTATQGAVGLAEWDDVRLPSRRDIVIQCLAEGGGRASIETLQTRIAAMYGEAPPKHALAWAGWALGARIVGPDLVMRSGAEGPEVTSLPGIPPEAAVLFEAMRAEEPHDLIELGRAVDQHARRFFHEAVTSDAIDLTVVLEAQRSCHALLAHAPEVGDEERRAISAAVRYFLHESDGAWDFTENGLSDDVAVLRAVIDALGLGAGTARAD